MSDLLTQPFINKYGALMRQIIFSALLFTGCATADQVKDLNSKVEEMEKKITELEKAPKAAAATAKTAEANPADETAAQALLKGMQEDLGKNDVAGAKAKYAEIEKKYASTRTFRRASKMGKELEVFGKAAPAAVTVDEWWIGDASSVSFEKGVSLLVFWEVWCPHCKREVPNVQKTFDTYSSKGLQVVGLTKLTRGKSKEEAMAFLKEKNVTYPIAKENGALSKHFNVSGIPAAAVVKDGTIVWRGHPARLTDEMITDWLK
jgi:outer membrane murein-binding lipoprotein Lpp/thiol-disulfide isomerase/thioredoxin